MTDTKDKEWTCALVLRSTGDSTEVSFKSMYDPEITEDTIKELGYVPACVSFMDNIAIPAVLQAATSHVDFLDVPGDLEAMDGSDTIN